MKNNGRNAIHEFSEEPIVVKSRVLVHQPRADNTMIPMFLILRVPYLYLVQERLRVTEGFNSSTVLIYWVLLGTWYRYYITTSTVLSPKMHIQYMVHGILYGVCIHCMVLRMQYVA